MKVVDSMVMHNGPAGITVGVQAVDEGGKVVIYGVISAARTTSKQSRRHHMDDVWDRRIGFLRVTGSLEKMGRAVFRMGEYDGTNLRADIFHAVRDIVRKQKKRRSIISLRNRLIRVVNPNFRFGDEVRFSYEAVVSRDDENVAVPMMGCARRCSGQAVPAPIASQDDIFETDEPVLEFDIGGEG